GCACWGAAAICCTSSLFFFQAEDGIRDGHVTGVQTCALPICACDKPDVAHDCFLLFSPSSGLILFVADLFHPVGGLAVETFLNRSEERRVGKEGRCGWGPKC